MKSPYKILNISAKSHINLVRKKYHKIAKKYHPDTTCLEKELALEKMQELNNAFQQIKVSVLDNVVKKPSKGRFSKSEIEEIIRRFKYGQSINKIGRDMKRKQRSIISHLTRLGFLEEEVHKEDKKFLKNNWYIDFLILTTLIILVPLFGVLFIYFLYILTLVN